MAMLGKRFQRTISMSQIGPGSNLHAEKQAQHGHHQQQQQQQEGEHAQCQPANQWEILKNAEAMMMMMMANSGANTSTKSSEEGPLLQERQANITAANSSKKNEQHPQISPAPSLSTASPSTLIVPTQHFLDACFFCKRRLRPERDIFIYRGDAAFCTEECRHRQILSDETRSSLGGASKKGGGGTTSETAVAA